MTLLLRFALLGMTLVQPVSPSRDSEEAIRHYRAGKDALTHDLFGPAEEEFRLAVKLDSLLVAAHHGLGQTLMATKRYPEAVNAFLAAREAFRLGQVRSAGTEMAMQRRLDEQIKALQDESVAARGRVTGPNASAVQAYIDRNEDQIRTLQSLRKRGEGGPLPTPHWLSFALGSACFRSGDLIRAEEEYRAALSQKGDVGEAHLNLGVVCMLTGRLAEAGREIALAEKFGVKVPSGLKDELKTRASKEL